MTRMREKYDENIDLRSTTILSSYLPSSNIILTPEIRNFKMVEKEETPKAYY